MKPIIEFADIMSRDQNYGFLITVFSNDRNPPHAHVLDLNRKEIGQIEITDKPPKSEVDVRLYKTDEIPPEIKLAIVEWANKTDPDFGILNWVSLKCFWKRFQASN